MGRPARTGQQAASGTDARGRVAPKSWPEPSTEEEYATEFLDYIGAPDVTGPHDPRVEGLVAWETAEATFERGNVNNPFDLEQLPGQPYPGQSTENLGFGPGLWNPQGVVMFSDFESGASAWSNQLQTSIDYPIWQALQDPHTDQQAFLDAIAASNLTGGGGGSQEELQYAQDIGSDWGYSGTIAVTTPKGTGKGQTSTGAETPGPLSQFAHTLGHDTVVAARNWAEMVGGVVLIAIGVLMAWQDLKGTAVGDALSGISSAVKGAIGLVPAARAASATKATQQARKAEAVERTASAPVLGEARRRSAVAGAASAQARASSASSQASSDAARARRQAAEHAADEKEAGNRARARTRVERARARHAEETARHTRERANRQMNLADEVNDRRQRAQAADYVRRTTVESRHRHGYRTETRTGGGPWTEEPF